jgi:hypothetical protein
MITCKDAKELQRRIQINVAAIKRTVPVVIEALDDTDEDLAIEETENLRSQADGLLAMLNEAKERKISHLVLYDSEW